MTKATRRELLAAGVAAGAAVAGAAGAGAAPEAKRPDGGRLPRRPLGKTGAEVSVLALGGYHLGTLASEKEAARLVHEAMEHGLDFFDNAWEYHDGKSELWLGNALEGRRDRAFVMTKLCSHGRNGRTAMEQLETSLRRLRTDHLDLWQLHEVIYADDPRRHFEGGAVEALARAKKEGKVRFVGFTGHKSPALHLEMLARGFPFDTVQLPLNPLDGTFESFERQVLPVLAKQQIAALGMKAMNGTGAVVKEKLLTAEECLRYALGLPVAAVVSGIDSAKVLRENVAIAKRPPMDEAERAALRERVRPVAAAGSHEAYKVSRGFDGPIGRAHHDL